MKNKKTQNETMTGIISLLAIVWLVALTVFTLWAWSMHVLQSKVDNEAIYQLRVENAQQQQIIDNL